MLNEVKMVGNSPRMVGDTEGLEEGQVGRVEVQGKG